MKNLTKCVAPYLTPVSRWVGLFLVIYLPLNAHAYIDPGTGILLWQGLIALIGALLFFIKHPKQAIKGLWRRIFKSKEKRVGE